MLGTSPCGLCRCFITPLTVPRPCMHWVIRFMTPPPFSRIRTFGTRLNSRVLKRTDSRGSQHLLQPPDLPEHLLPAVPVVHGIMGVLPPSRYRPAFITVGNRRECCEPVSESPSPVAGFHATRAFAVIPTFRWSIRARNFRIMPGLFQVPDPFHHLVLGEAQPFSDLFKGCRDEREAAFQFPEKGDISRYPWISSGAGRNENRTSIFILLTVGRSRASPMPEIPVRSRISVQHSPDPHLVLCSNREPEGVVMVPPEIVGDFRITADDGSNLVKPSPPGHGGQRALRHAGRAGGIRGPGICPG